MAETIGGTVLNFGLRFISRKATEKLQNGDLADQEFRDYIVRELDDIKSKINAFCRTDLYTSISDLKKGVQRLRKSFESKTSTTYELPKDGKQSQDTTNAGASSSQTTPAQQSVTVEDAVALANAIGELKIESKERFEAAKESFKEAGKAATRAFHNTALSTTERILATQVRIASGILENLDDPDLAASDCLHYLEELHDMPAIKEIFSVYLEGGIKAVFKRESRVEIVETVKMINSILADFISKFKNQKMAILDWPMIECGERVVLPIHYEKEDVQKMREMKITPPWDITKYKKSMGDIMDFAINSKGDVIGVFSDDDHPRKLDKATGEWQPFCLSPSNDKMWPDKSVAIDDNDTVYVVSFKAGSFETLLVYSSEGKITHYCTFDFIKTAEPLGITVNEDREIIIYGKYTHYFMGTLTFQENTVYVCDSTGKLIKSIPTRKSVGSVLRAFVPGEKSADKEIIVATCENRYDILFRVYTQAGELKKTINCIPQLASPSTVE
ncbi:Hypothetical predicted protein, partial [Paramuricea clavata]